MKRFALGVILGVILTQSLITPIMSNQAVKWIYCERYKEILK